MLALEPWLDFLWQCFTLKYMMILPCFETVSHFVKKSKAWIFLQHAYEFVVIST
jgi:hypothetical protein